MKYAYYPGCSLQSTAREYDESFRAVCQEVGLELQEVKDWICCGSSWAHPRSELLAVALPMKVLAQTEDDGFQEVVVPCAECYSRLKIAQHEVANNPQLAKKIEGIIEHKFKKEIKVSHPLEIFDSSEWLDKFRKSVKKTLPGLKVVCYYGCLLARPPKATGFADYEYPQSMERILEAVGIETLDWTYKTDCCGASFAMTRTDIVLKLSNDIMAGAETVGAEAIAVACPMCQSNMDTRQEEIEQEYKKTYHLPIVFFTQLIGLALGIPAERLHLDKHLVDAEKVLAKVK